MYYELALLANLSHRFKWAFLIKICPLSVVVVVDVNFSHFHLLLQNHWANFNQTWHKASLNEGDSYLFIRRAPPFYKGRQLKSRENTLARLKNLLLQNHWANFNQNWHNTLLGEGDSILFKWRPRPFRRGDNLKNSEKTLTKLKNLLLQNHWANFNQTWHNALLGEWDSSLFKWRACPFPRGDN